MSRGLQYAIRDLDEVARLYNERHPDQRPIGRARVWQIEREAIEKMRDQLKEFSPREAACKEEAIDMTFRRIHQPR